MKLLPLFTGRRRALSLVELVLFLAIFGMLIGTTIPLISLGSNHYFYQKSTSLVENDGVVAVRTITDAIRSAEFVVSPQKGQTGSVLVLQTGTGTNGTVVFGAINGLLTKMTYSNQSLPVGTEVSIKNFSVQNASTTTGTGQHINVSFTLYVTAGLPMRTYSRPFAFSVALFPHTKQVGNPCNCPPPYCARSNTFTWSACNPFSLSCETATGSFVCSPRTLKPTTTTITATSNPLVDNSVQLHFTVSPSTATDYMNIYKDGSLAYNWLAIRQGSGSVTDNPTTGSHTYYAVYPGDYYLTTYAPSTSDPLTIQIASCPQSHYSTNTAVFNAFAAPPEWHDNYPGCSGSGCLCHGAPVLLMSNLKTYPYSTYYLYADPNTGFSGNICTHQTTRVPAYGCLHDGTQACDANFALDCRDHAVKVGFYRGSTRLSEVELYELSNWPGVVIPAYADSAYVYVREDSPAYYQDNNAGGNGNNQWDCSVTVQAYQSTQCTN